MGGSRPRRERRSRRRFAPLFAFVAGLGVGAAITSHLWLVTARALLEATPSRFGLEQEMLATHQPARDGLEAIYRADAAIALERLGRSEDAMQEWVRALGLAPSRSVAWHRKRHAWPTSKCAEARMTAIETAWLDSPTHFELDASYPSELCEE